MSRPTSSWQPRIRSHRGFLRGHQQVTERSPNRDAPLEERLLERCRPSGYGRNLTPWARGRTGGCIGWTVVVVGADHRPTYVIRVLPRRNSGLPEVAGKLSGPVAGLPPDIEDRFRAQVIALPAEIEVLSMRELTSKMALLQQRHRSEGRGMSAAMVEALAAAHRLSEGIAVSTGDVGPNFRDSAIADGIAFHAL